MRIHQSFIRPAMLIGSLALAAPCVQAADISPLLLTQGEFRLLSEDLGSVTSYKPLIPSEGLGITGFDVGIAVTGTRIQNRDIWKKASNNSDVPSTVPVPTLRVHKGLPFDIDVGLTYSKIPSTNIQIAGGELRWAFIPGGTATPAVAVRASYTTLTGVDHLSLHTTGVDLSVSKGFLFLTPYAGVGIVSVKSSTDSPFLSNESFTQNKVFAGVNLNFGLANLAFETDKTGKAASYGAKFGFRF